MVRRMLHHIISNVTPKPRPPTPADYWQKVAQSFISLNPGVCTPESFREDVVHELSGLHHRLSQAMAQSSDEEGVGQPLGRAPSTIKRGRGKTDVQDDIVVPEWSYRIDDIYELCLAQAEPEAQEAGLKELAEICSHFMPPSPAVTRVLSSDRLDVGYVSGKKRHGESFGSRALSPEIIEMTRIWH
eukprot:m.148187 g.148187  ORF g.148187 m.148187 type:complete len:186 (-) comp16127_c1_seq4:160-717(-)